MLSKHCCLCLSDLTGQLLNQPLGLVWAVGLYLLSNKGSQRVLRDLFRIVILQLCCVGTFFLFFLMRVDMCHSVIHLLVRKLIMKLIYTAILKSDF